MMHKRVILISSIILFALTFNAVGYAVQNDDLSSPNEANSPNVQINNNSNKQMNSSLSPSNSSNASSDYAAGGESGWNGMHAYWMWTMDVNNFDPYALKNSGITDLFFVVKGTSGNLYYSELAHAIELCKPAGIWVHAWIICFNDKSRGSWVNQSDQAYQEYLGNITTYIINNYDVAGIHLDYVRYSGVEPKNQAAWQQPGGTAAAVDTITNFVGNIYDIVKVKDPELALSAAVMPECSDNAYYYGQDYGRLADYLDFIVPMIYKGTFKTDTRWIGETTKWIIAHSNGKPVIAGIMTYRNDEDQTMLPADELALDVKTALINGASGFALFRYGLTSAVPGLDILDTVASNAPAGPEDNKVALKALNKIAMKETGLPISLIFLAMFMIISGLIRAK